MKPWSLVLGRSGPLFNIGSHAPWPLCCQGKPLPDQVYNDEPQIIPRQSGMRLFYHRGKNGIDAVTNKKVKRISKSISIAFALAIFLIAPFEVFADPTSLDYRFDGSISFQVLQNYLSRAIHMGRFGEGVGNTADNIRMVKSIGAKYLGRVIVPFGKEQTIPQRLQNTRTIGAQVHANDPDVILEGGIFEHVTTQVNSLPIPAYVFQAFGVPVVTRNFRHAEMVFADNPIIKKRYKVPDITKLETRLWFYYLATSQIDAGIESIHWGWFEPQSYNDKPNYPNYYDLLAKVRAYAKIHARRHFVLNNADSNIAVAVGGKLLFDFGSGNLHSGGMAEVLTDPQKCILTGRYAKSGAGITPSGWSTTRLPYLRHFDNTDYKGHGGTPGNGSWGWDEISWFAHQPEAYRNEFLRYADNHVNNEWSGNPGHLEMPGMRVINPLINGNHNYFANSRALNSLGFNQVETIRQIWKSSNLGDPTSSPANKNKAQ